MRLRAGLAVCSFACMTIAALGHSVPESDWKKAILKDIQKEQQTFIPASNQPYTSGGTYTILHYIIETPEITYDVVPQPMGRTLNNLRTGKLDLAVNATIEYAIEKNTMYLRDTEHQVGEFRIEKKTINQKAIGTNQ